MAHSVIVHLPQELTIQGYGAPSTFVENPPHLGALDRNHIASIPLYGNRNAMF